MKVFIGSSLESSDELRKIAMLIEEAGYTPFPWNKAGVFLLGKYMLESLRDISMKVDAAILIFNEDDKVWYRNDYVLAPRDNVVLEYGFLLSILGKEKTIICRKGTTKIASDLSGIIYCDLNKEYRAQIELLEWLRFINSGCNK
ncbi:hypothetical protein QJ48_02140 [Paenibacillus sp. A3]|uniref:nucleotide-binding protein n=1 Tax=Paenibacillus sp. A3 TaxID=1337054 RepID=UPI0006D54A18|nr:nucleotide-binding protein [Paenibacillus sp. A3]KPV61046.1 hypothetical protein QJ48_02140 [Paenibacillus sp. A3]